MKTSDPTWQVQVLIFALGLFLGVIFMKIISPNQIDNYKLVIEKEPSNYICPYCGVNIRDEMEKQITQKLYLNGKYVSGLVEHKVRVR